MTHAKANQRRSGIRQNSRSRWWFRNSGESHYACLVSRNSGESHYAFADTYSPFTSIRISRLSSLESVTLPNVIRLLSDSTDSDQRSSSLA